MDIEQILAQRAKTIVEVSAALLKAGYSFTKKEASTGVYLEVTHPDLPDWHRFVNVEEDREGQLIAGNILRIPGKHRTRDLSRGGITKMMKRLNDTKTQVMVIRQRNADMAAADARYAERQKLELSGVEIPEWMTVNIRSSGDHAGRYRVSFEQGSPMERLTAGEVKRLVEIMREVDSLDAAEDANRSI